MARASRLRLDAATAELFSRFDAGGVNALLLKGPSITQWLYTDLPPRPYLDCDVLVAPADIKTAEEILACADYTRAFDDRTMPSWWREHASAWLRESDQLTVDLHRTLVGIGVGDEEAWRLLSADVAAVGVHGREVPTLGLPARALHVVLHVAQHGAGWHRATDDLQRALTAVNDDTWLAAARLGAELRATDAFAAGLSLTPAGARLAARLRLPQTISTDARLRANAPPPLALGFQQLASARGVQIKMEIIWRKLVPPANFIRHWDPRAEEGHIALLRAYLRRPLWLVRHAPRAMQAWHSARRSLRTVRSAKER